MGSTGSLVFTGISSYSNDLQSILTRAVSIAQLPVKSLQNSQADNLSKKQALIALNPAVANLGSAIAALGTMAVNGGGLVATSSDASSVSLSNTGATAPATYSVSNVVSLASSAWATTDVYADTDTTPVTANGYVDLKVGTAPLVHLDIRDNNNLGGLVDSINAAGLGVTATILITATGNYLSISANSTGAQAITLNDTSSGSNVSLLKSSDAGSNADFMLNSTIHVVRSSNVVSDIIPGITFTLRSIPASPVKLALTSEPTDISNALQAFAGNYNTLLDQVNAQVGPAAGALGGDMIIRDIMGDTQRLASYWNASSGTTIRSLSDLGITFELTGHISFDQNVFSGLSSTQLNDALKFLGSSKTGFAALAGNFTQLSNASTGLIRLEEDGLDAQNLKLTDQINTLNDRVTQLQNNMTAKLQAADALLAQLESRKNLVTASLQSLNFVTYGKVAGAGE